MHESTTELDSGLNVHGAQGQRRGFGSGGTVDAGDSEEEDEGLYIHDLFD